MLNIFLRNVSMTCLETYQELFQNNRMDSPFFKYLKVFRRHDKTRISMPILMTISSRDRDILLPAHSQAHDEKHTVTDISTAPTAADMEGIMTI